MILFGIVSFQGAHSERAIADRVTGRIHSASSGITEILGGTMLQLTPERTERILSDPSFKELVSTRAKLRWALSAITLVMFFGFILLISLARGALATNIAGSGIPVGLGLAFAMIVVVVVLTGIYVFQSNARFDPLTRALNREFDQ
jgi:uncharacterized membrane protein (DUF485 family)